MKDQAKEQGIRPGDKVWCWDYDEDEKQKGVFLGHWGIDDVGDILYSAPYPYSVKAENGKSVFKNIEPYINDEIMEGCKFYVGQKVRDHVLFPDLGVGTIEEIDHRHIGVRFPGQFRNYRIGGNYFPPYIPTLVPADEGFDLHIPAPEPEFERYERVLVRNWKSKPWEATLYHHKCVGHQSAWMADASGTLWRHFRKWDESLIGKVTE